MKKKIKIEHIVKYNKYASFFVLFGSRYQKVENMVAIDDCFHLFSKSARCSVIMGESISVDLCRSSFCLDFIKETGLRTRFTRHRWKLGRYFRLIKNSNKVKFNDGIKRTISELGTYSVFDTPKYNRRIKQINAQLDQFKRDPESILNCGFELETQDSPGSLMNFVEDPYGAFHEMDLVASYIKDNPTKLMPDYEQLKAEWIKKLNLEGMEVKEDGSVNGVEIATVGPKTPAQFKDALQKVFEYEHQIDNRCSFHIHLRVGDIKHNFSKGTQQSIITYLFQNADQLPPSVLERWSDGEASYFFEIIPRDKKESFIRFHPQGTIEFRCFGNITSYEEGIQCLELATKALKFAIESKNTTVELDAWYRDANKSMDEGTVDSLQAFSQFHEKLLSVLTPKDSEEDVMSTYSSIYTRSAT